MKGKLKFQDRAGGRSTCYFEGVNSAESIVSIAEGLKNDTNAKIVEAAVRDEASIVASGYPKTEPPYDSISVRAYMTFRYTDLPVGEPDLKTLQFFCPISAMVMASNGEYVVIASYGNLIAAAISAAIPYTLEFKYGKVVGVQI
jgi:hypothetical protein